MEETIDQFITFLRDIRNVSENTAISYKRDLKKMMEYFVQHGILTEDKITATSMNTYILTLERSGCAAATISRYLASMKSYFHYLQQIGKIREDPTLMVKSPVPDRKSPKVLNVGQVDLLLAQPSDSSNKGIRDKAMLELLYATGIRVTELVSIKMEDINLELGYLVVGGKNARERVIPFGDSARRAVFRYVMEARDKLLKEKSSDFLFINCSGKAMSRQGFWKIIKNYGEKAGIRDEITPHTLRHSFAMHMVENGADLEAVREMMGHSVLATTQAYANMRQTNLSTEYKKAHPRK